MTDNEQIVEQLRRAHAAEPAPVLDPARTLRAGRRARQRKTVARWSGMAAAGACALVLGVGMAGGWGRTPDRVAEPAPAQTPSFTAATVLDAYGGYPKGASDPFDRPPEGDTGFTRGPEPAVDTGAGTVTLWTGGSYSCPAWPKAIRGYGDTIDIVVGPPDEVPGCTADFRVTTYVVELPHGYAPEGEPVVNVLSQGPVGTGGVPTDLPADDAGGCRPALTVCAMERWLDEMLRAAGLEPLGDTYDPLTGGDTVLIGGDHVSATLGPPEYEGRIPIEVSRTTNVGPVVVQHGTSSDGVVPAAVLTCGGFVIRLDGSAWLPPADIFAQTAERIAATITECPSDLDELVEMYPDLGR